MGHILLLVVLVVVILVFLLIGSIALLDFMDSTGWRPGLDWWTIFFALLAIGGFAGLAYVIWIGR